MFILTKKEKLNVKNFHIQKILYVKNFHIQKLSQSGLFSIFCIQNCFNRKQIHAHT